MGHLWEKGSRVLGSRLTAGNLIESMGKVKANRFFLVNQDRENTMRLGLRVTVPYTVSGVQLIRAKLLR